MSKHIGVYTNTHYHGYESQIVSRDPLIMYINNFLSISEASHFLHLSEGKFQPSPLYRGDDVLIDETRRLSEFVEVKRDDLVKRVERRARKFQGWRRKSTQLQPPRVQKYKEGGFLDYHYDWDPLVDDGNRVTTFMIYLTDNCTGGETNFSRVKKFKDPRWCSSILDCNSTYPGITFRPVAGSAVFWENMYPNGSLHDKVIHAALPVLSGEKIGLNLWFWDSEWKKSQGET
ncbi:hypothetical protein QQS21_012681 [Conoideocrella luteorostrata]|uniref:Fe2OG dioxygenase domain-containing protein n=1 Tax=Conoideocrella luteorostrata TaxID=1105319 RepID=A0AAJ0CF96_9HYPO|nr:hypothetical protein QQS21_012681 [Conoideocrella luteorostrata]